MKPNPSSEFAASPAAPDARRFSKGRSRIGRWALRIVGAIVAVPVVAVLVLWATRSDEQKQLGKALDHVASLFSEEAGPDHATTAHLEVARAGGLPKQFAGLKADVAFGGQEHFWLAATVDKQLVQLARNGQEIWVWEPWREFGIDGLPGVPRFSSTPETSRDNSRLGPMKLPIDHRLLALLPRFLSVQTKERGTFEGLACRELVATAPAWLGRWVKLPPVSLSVWVRDSDGWPTQLACADGRSLDVDVVMQNLHTSESVPASRWAVPVEAAGKIQKVALSHLSHFFQSAVSLALTRVPALGPATGERRVIATHGKGRLEMRDGARVLFLSGTPEEMGEEQGTLLEPEVRALVDRIVYGVGVGSSFAKGRWFFGEIEECQSRIQPFIDPRDLREMDAMAQAAGLAKEEMRLANFFPELFHCSGFALMGQATAGGRIYHGRVLDYLRGVGLESAAVVTVNRPDQGHAWVNVGYAGFIGSVTAMNDQHISMGEMGGRGEGHWDGKPMAELVREVMEKAGTLDEAIAILKNSPRTCEYFYVIADGKSHTAVGIAATPESLDVLHPGEAHPRLPTPIQDAVLMSAGDRYAELVRRVQADYGRFDADSARDLMTRPVCMNSNIHSVLFAPDTLDFWVANADSKNVASATRYTHYNLAELLKSADGSNP